ncbi:starch phosphorylase [Desulfonatronum thiosulfatophilum]|uniref:Starch phosphorylase n=1 Tax=Desulfonatronum thiosulfatophilum TaxID=617002 RepID=A0A1G6E1M4_9BACT|nr:alpha-glucan family phosphorylase [Desulfonatronum thiosulfatophilum]SDB51281.1 starch phosphorylase [Desulfonatronum thiosulfatophilum]
MKPLHTYSVIPKLPPNLDALWDLAYNVWFDWNHEVTGLFSLIDPKLWAKSYGNPIAFLNHLPQTTLESLAKDDFFLERLRSVKHSQDIYMERKSSMLPFSYPERQPLVAYFSLEYGLSLCLPIYSGGLGILAGDHLKSASDLNIPLVGVGLAYQQGYFRQYLTADGWQNERYPDYGFEQMPMTLVRSETDHKPVIINVDLAGQPLSAQIWKVRVGRIHLYLLDTNIHENPPHFRQITSRLYGGDLEMRIWQEILLGIGGIKALSILGLTPRVIHMNEGHSAFAGLERIRVFMTEYGLSFEAAMELTASTSVFTTHTPVPAGNDRFPAELMQRYFDGYARSLGLAFKVLLALGREDPRNDGEWFCMTVLALRLSRFNNGVSELHGHVSRRMWQKVWPQYPVEDIPIGTVTNGVHIASWVARDIAMLFERYLGGNWKEDPDYTRVWQQAETIPDGELWRAHERLRERVVDYARARLRIQLAQRDARRTELLQADEVLDPQVLTIGFARRFATYKRATLLLADKERFLKMITDPKRPVQFIFAGKSHPHDNEGKRFMQQLVQFCQQPEVRNRVVFLEDYDMEVAEYMVQGCDVWLNTPRRPLEACGTSGMKAIANGVLHVSTLDGWWVEAHRMDSAVGWSIGQGEEYDDSGYQDFVESQILYNLLEKEVIPTFYERGQTNFPREWIRRMKKCLQLFTPVFTSHRMVADYVKNAYEPAYKNSVSLMEQNFAPAKQLASWRMDIMTKWNALRINNVRSDVPEIIHVAQPIAIQADVYLNGLAPHDVCVEIYAGPVSADGSFTERKTAKMDLTKSLDEGWFLYEGQFTPETPGSFGFTVRMLPSHEHLLDPHSLGLIHWAQ